MNQSKKASVFDKIINELTLEDTGTEQLDQCMQFNYSLSRKVPLRYKIVSVGFVRKYTLNELNTKLQQYGLARLYPRNLWEASILYAFSNGITYDEWHGLVDSVKEIKDSLQPNTDLLSQKNITLKLIKEYVDENSDLDNKAELLTKHQTRRLETAVSSIHFPEEFLAFLRSNISEFSAVREKTRYYFCKYLYYYLERKIDSYLKIASRGIHYRLKDIMDELSIFQGASQVKRSSMTSEQIREFLECSSISCGVLYAEFNEFFFGYVSLDWMQVLLEQAGDLKNLPPKNIKKLADAARHYDKKYSKMEDAQIIKVLDAALEQQEKELDREASLDSFERGYQKNRMGENTIRKYLKGTLDLDRTTFLCFLLFFASDLTTPARLYLNQKRLDEILHECGFLQLDPYNDFDYFVINFLTAGDPVDYLMEEVTRYAISMENFYLYKLYQASRSDDADIGKLLTS